MAEQAGAIRDAVAGRAHAARHYSADLVTEDPNRAAAALADAPADKEDAR
ncbi:MULTISPECIES: hypothetical protein [unclassified Nocardiopsis]|nr:MULTISPECIES: hypothetical protein [unclassified Nocardiopsis]